jgi:hypothetical protein
MEMSLIAVGQITISNGVASKIVDARPGRRSITMNLPSGNFYLGRDDGVTNSNGFKVALQSNLSVEFETSDELWLYNGTGSSQTISYFELFDE